VYDYELRLPPDSTPAISGRVDQHGDARVQLGPACALSAGEMAVRPPRNTSAKRELIRAERTGPSYKPEEVKS
jgi:hypothetical protein